MHLNSLALLRKWRDYFFPNVWLFWESGKVKFKGSCIMGPIYKVKHKEPNLLKSYLICPFDQLKVCLFFEAESNKIIVGRQHPKAGNMKRETVQSHNEWYIRKNTNDSEEWVMARETSERRIILSLCLVREEK